MHKSSLLKKKPFKLCTTSFIYPDNIIPNVKKLGSQFDEIELLIFESQPFEVVPSQDEVNTLLSLSKQLNLSFNVHLPIDVSITDPVLDKRTQAVECIKQVIDRFDTICPTTHTLHLDLHDQFRTNQGMDQFKDICFNSLSDLLSFGVNPKAISVETLDYPFDCLDQIIEDLNLTVCVDIGHVIKYGYDLEAVFQKHKSRIPIVHFHGVDTLVTPAKDHLGLDKMDNEVFLRTLKILRNFTGTLSLEVFHKSKLDDSVKYLQNYFDLSLEE